MPDDLPSAADFETDQPKGGDAPELKPLDERTVAEIVSQEISDAETFTGSGISGEQADALDAYYGRPMGNEVKGRSQVILTDVRDTIEWIMPTLMKLFFGGRSVIRYIPQGEEDIEWAEQATQYAQYLTRRGNAGFLTFHDWFKDALLEKLGVVTLFYDDKVCRDLERYTELSQEEMDVLLAEEGVELVAFEETTRMEEAPPEELLPEPHVPIPVPEIPNETMEPEPIEVSEFEVHIRRLKPQGTIRIEGMPQEEFLVASRARRVDDNCPFVGRRTKVTYSDLRGMGFSPALIESLPTAESHEFSQQSIERREDEQLTPTSAYDRVDWASREVWLTECWLRIDEDGDGYAELRRILCAGDSGLKILEDDEVSHIPICTLCPVPVPHKLYGLSWADLIIDLQRLRSTLVRQIMDNVYLTNNGRYEVVEGEVEIEDLLTTEPGGVVRVSAPGMVSALETPSLGQSAFGLLEYLHGVKEDRTGVTRYNQGRDASTLNQTATGVSAIMDAANLRIEMIARIFAETGVKRLYEQLLLVMRENKIKPEMIRLRDEWIDIDPRMWKASMDVEVEVGLGTAQSSVRVDNMMLLHDLQKQIAEFDGRMVSPENVYAAIERIPEAMGFTTEGLFFTKPDMDEDPPPPPPDPKMVEIEAKQENEKAKIQIELETLKFRRDQALAEGQLKMEEMKTRIRVAEIQAQAMLAQARIHSDSDERSNLTKAGTELVKADLSNQKPQ